MRHRTVSLPPSGEAVGRVLLSYITAPFSPGFEAGSANHSNLWECSEIARILRGMGYAVDVIDWDDADFVPKRRYDIFIDIHGNMERLAPLVGEECLKVVHVTGSHWLHQNRAEYERLSGKPDLLMFDGQGIAHPSGLGLASHLGVLLDKASLGCAKSRLVGEFKEPKQKRGAMRTLSFERRKVGVVLRTRDNTKPVFVSPGHRITVETAAARVLGATKGYRIPEPTRLADVEAERAKRERRR